MSVVNVKEMWSGASLTSGSRRMSARRRFSVLFDRTPDTLREACEAPGIPAKGQAYPGVPFLLANGIEASPVGPLLYEVTVAYDWDSSGSGQYSPIDKPADLQWNTVETTEPIDTDINGKPLANTVGEPFDPPLAEVVVDMAATYTRAELFWMPWQIGAFANTLNAKKFLDWSPGCVWLRSISARRVVVPDLVYYEVTYSMTFRLDGWDRRILNQGYQYWDATYVDEDETQKNIVRIVDANGRPSPQPLPLYDDGSLIGEQYRQDPTKLHWLTFETKRRKDWTPLALE